MSEHEPELALLANEESTLEAQLIAAGVCRDTQLHGRRDARRIVRTIDMAMTSLPRIRPTVVGKEVRFEAVPSGALLKTYPIDCLSGAEATRLIDVETLSRELRAALEQHGLASLTVPRLEQGLASHVSRGLVSMRNESWSRAAADFRRSLLIAEELTSRAAGDERRRWTPHLREALSEAFGSCEAAYEEVQHSGADAQLPRNRLNELATRIEGFLDDVLKSP